MGGVGTEQVGEVRVVGEQEQKGAGEIGTKQIQELNSLSSEAWGGWGVGENLDSLSD